MQDGRLHKCLACRCELAKGRMRRIHLLSTSQHPAAPQQSPKHPGIKPIIHLVIKPYILPSTRLSCKVCPRCFLIRFKKCACLLIYPFFHPPIHVFPIWDNFCAFWVPFWIYFGSFSLCVCMHPRPETAGNPSIDIPDQKQLFFQKFTRESLARTVNGIPNVFKI